MLTVYRVAVKRSIVGCRRLAPLSREVDDQLPLQGAIAQRRSCRFDERHPVSLLLRKRAGNVNTCPDRSLCACSLAPNAGSFHLKKSLGYVRASMKDRTATDHETFVAPAKKVLRSHSSHTRHPTLDPAKSWPETCCQLTPEKLTPKCPHSAPILPPSCPRTTLD